jgi:hypothetical protein
MISFASSSSRRSSSRYKSSSSKTLSSHSFILGFLIAILIAASVFFLLYSNKTATSGYVLRGLQYKQAHLISEIERWNNKEIQNSVISHMSKSELAGLMRKPITITQLKNQHVAQN